jgi:hypothetical protein
MHRVGPVDALRFANAPTHVAAATARFGAGGLLPFGSPVGEPRRIFDGPRDIHPAGLG